MYNKRLRLIRICEREHMTYLEPNGVTGTKNKIGIEYGTMLHVNGITHNLFELTDTETVRRLRALHKFHRPQTKSESAQWLLCSLRMGLCNELRFMIAQYLRRLPLYLTVK